MADKEFLFIEQLGHRGTSGMGFKGTNRDFIKFMRILGAGAGNKRIVNITKREYDMAIKATIRK